MTDVPPQLPDETMPTRCTAGRKITRDDGRPYLGLDWSSPCPHPVIGALNIEDLGLLVGICLCHVQALEHAGMLGTASSFRNSEGEPNP